jgi:UDP-N-acetylmuramate--alanine ligase
MEDRCGIVVAGDRLASLTTAMIGRVLIAAGKDPTVLLGTPSPELGGWVRDGAGVHLVAEWAGPTGQLGAVGARLSVVLDVGGDPWNDTASWVAQIRTLPDSHSMPVGVIALGHPALVADLPEVARGTERFEWVSLDRGSTWWGTDLREGPACSRFRAFYRGQFVTEVVLCYASRRMVLGALAAVAACVRLGVPTRQIREGLEEFSGLSRDFERRGSYRGVTLLDDSATDPWSISQVLALARRAFGRRRLWAVFAAADGTPHEDSEAPARFIPAFSAADKVLIAGGETDGMAGRSATDGGTTWGQALLGALASAGVPAVWTPGLSAAVRELDRHLEPGDVLLTLGAGEVGTIADAFLRRLSRDRQAG